MSADPVLLLAWLVLAHLVADFVLQTERVASEKFGTGWRAWRALAVHVAGVALALAPFALVFGSVGLALVVIVAVAHGLIDRTKILLTRRVEAAALAAAHRVHEPPAPAASLGRGWTPVPAALFVVDQAAHVLVLWLAWLALLRTAAPLPDAASAVSSVAGADPAGFHRAVLTAVVLAALGLVNVRAGAILVGVLVRPLPALEGSFPAADPAPATGTAAPSARGYLVRLGPLVGRVEPEPGTSMPGQPARMASPARVGEAIGILERLLVVALLLARAEAAIGLVIAAKTLARFKQLDDREFAEYYLLGTLASVSVAVGSALVAAAALGIAV
ncbi:MAG TPA: DUF3307 domain-containing protein [Candidatus Limnocylindrales bacterium]